MEGKERGYEFEKYMEARWDDVTMYIEKSLPLLLLILPEEKCNCPFSLGQLRELSSWQVTPSKLEGFNLVYSKMIINKYTFHNVIN